MLKVEKLVTPNAEQFDIVIKGMRHPFKSTDKSDSHIIPFGDEDWDIKGSSFILGEEDKQRLLNLCSAGDPSHRKLLRQLPVIMDINAPLYWHKQMDQYKIGTVTDSESTMHSMTKYPFKIEDFSTEGLDNIFGEHDYTGKELLEFILIPYLNSLRDKYLENNDKVFWNGINKLLPHSYLQTRCWSGNYETLVNIIKQRSTHPLVEWKQFIDYILENVPYLKEIVEAVNES